MKSVNKLVNFYTRDSVSQQYNLANPSNDVCLGKQ